MWHRRRAAASVGAGALVCGSGIEKEEGDGERESQLFLKPSGLTVTLSLGRKRNGILSK